MSDGPPFKPDLLGSETVTILCRPIREVRVGRPRVRRDRLGAHASAEGLMRRLVDASRVRIPVPVRSRPRWSRRIPTRIAHGIGHDYAWVFMDSIGNKAVNPKLAESAPNSMLRRRRQTLWGSSASVSQEPSSVAPSRLPARPPVGAGRPQAGRHSSDPTAATDTRPGAAGGLVAASTCARARRNRSGSQAAAPSLAIGNTQRVQTDSASRRQRRLDPPPGETSPAFLRIDVELRGRTDHLNK